MLFSYSEVIVMKVNESSVTIQSTKLYMNFTTYEQAGEDEPYITAVFNGSYIKEVSVMFKLGKYC